MNVPLYEHFLAGVTLALADRLLSKNAKRYRKERIDEKMKTAEALNYILEAENKEDKSVKQNQEYIEAIIKATNYFEERGIDVIKNEDGISRVKGWFHKIPEAIAYYKNNERINNLGWKEKITLGFGLEFIADLGVALTGPILHAGNFWHALGKTTYQGPVMGLGFIAGGYALTVKDALFKSKQEKEIDSVLYELTRNSKLIEILKEHYSKPVEIIELENEEPKQLEPPTELKERISEGVSKGVGYAAEAVKSVGQGIAKGISDIKGAIDEKQKKAEEDEKARMEELRKKYNKY
jgi:hypothetical protein